MKEEKPKSKREVAEEEEQLRVLALDLDLLSKQVEEALRKNEKARRISPGLWDQEFVI